MNLHHDGYYQDFTPLVKCKHCGQWATVFTECAHCGAPVDPPDSQKVNPYLRGSRYGEVVISASTNSDMWST